jgi:hypothetical protein
VPPRAGNIRSLLLRCPQTFFEANFMPLENRQTALRLPAIRCLRMAVTISSSVKSGCPATSASSHCACFSNGDMLPPLGLAATLPVASQRCIHLIAELALTS